MRGSILSFKRVLFAGLISLAALAATAHAQYGVPAYDVLKPADNEQLTRSPDGRHIAFVNSVMDSYCFDGEGQMKAQGDNNCSERLQQYRSKHTIIVYDLDKAVTVKVLAVPENYLVTWLDWASSERLLASLHLPSAEGRGGRRKVGGEKTLSIPLIGEDYVYLFGDQYRIGKQNRYQSAITDILLDDPEHVIIPASDSSRYHLWKVNIFTGKAEVIGKATPTTFEWFTDGEGKPSLRFDCEGGIYCPRVSVHARAIGTSGDEASHWSQIMTLKVKPFEDRYDYKFWPMAAGPTKGQFYVFSNGKDDISANVKLYDTVQKKFIKTVYQNPDYDVRGAIFDTDTEDYIAAWYYKDRLTYDFADPVVKGHYDIIQARFLTPHNIRILEYSEKHQRAIIEASSPNNPGEYYLYDLETQDLSLLVPKSPDLDQVFDSKTDIMDITTRDGTGIRAYLTYPKGRELSDTPLLVMPHDGPNTRNFYGYDWLVQYFVSHGYSVLQVNHRGSYGYGSAFLQARYGEWGGKMQTDVIDAVKTLYSDGRASPEKTCVIPSALNSEYGDYVSMMAGAQTPELFKCIVTSGTDNDLNETIKNAKIAYGRSSAAYEYWVSSIGDPKADKDKLKMLSPIHMAENFTLPTLVTHAHGESNKMYKALKRQNKPVERLKNDTLIESGAWTKIAIFKLEGIKDFLDEHLEP